MKHYGLELEQGTEITNITVETGNSFPLTPSVGTLFYSKGAGSVLAGMYQYSVGNRWEFIPSSYDGANNGWLDPLNVYSILHGGGGGGGSLILTGDITGSGTGTVATTLSTTGVSAGTYKSVTVDTKGRVTAATNPTTLAGFGITDGQPLDGDLTAIAGLAGTTGILQKTGVNTWALDTSTYLTTATWTGSLIRMVGYTSNGTFSFTSSANAKSLVVFVTGSGGGGGVRSGSGYGSGGGAGGTAIKFISLTTPITVSVVVAAGGIGSTSGNGLSGGTSSFGSYCSATGGTGSQNTNYALGGVGVGGTINLRGGAGDTGSGKTGNGGNSFWGGNGGSSVSNGSPGYNGSGGAGRESGGTIAANGGHGVVLIFEFM